MPIERELKLRPDEPRLLDRLERLERLGAFEVVARRRERQRNALFDTPSRALLRAGISFRRRVVEGRSLAAWTLKARGATADGVSARPEVEVHLAADTPPVVALGVLRQAARERTSGFVAEQVSEALADSSPPRAEPFVEFETDRRILDLIAAGRDWRAEMALDHVRMPAHPEYEEWEIEVELERGDDETLQAARAAIEEVAEGRVRPSEGTKNSRALAFLRRIGRMSDGARAAADR